MKKQDEYIIKDDGHSYIYTKNGKIHREVGPAIFSYDNKSANEYINLEDKYLYKIKQVQSSRREVLFESEMAKLKYNKLQDSKIHYFLEDKEYSKEEFEAIKAKLNMKNELSTELSLNQSQSKKSKI